jgi:hypothetical protein
MAVTAFKGERLYISKAGVSNQTAGPASIIDLLFLPALFILIAVTNSPGLRLSTQSMGVSHLG